MTCDTCLHYVEEWNAIEGHNRPVIYELCGEKPGVFVLIPVERTCKKWEQVIDLPGRGDGANV